MLGRKNTAGALAVSDPRGGRLNRFWKYLRRYWFLDSIADIAQSFQFSQSKVATTLHRTRLKLRKKLEKEGYL